MLLTQSQEFALETITQNLTSAGIILLYGSAGTLTKLKNKYFNS